MSRGVMVRALALLLLLASCDKADGPKRDVDVTTIDMPKAEARALDTELPKLLVIITRDATVYVGGKPTPDLLQALTEARRSRGYDEIWIDADHDVAYAAVVQVMATAKEAGMVRIQLVTERLRPPQPAP